MTAKRHVELCRLIQEHNRHYYLEDAPIVTDAQYDALFRELMNLENNDPSLVSPESPTQRIGATPREGFTKVAHKVAMLSLDNAYDRDELNEFDRRVHERSKTSVDYIAEPKIDGASVEVVYRDGKYSQAITRGDGAIGEDVTESVKTIRMVPLTIGERRDFTVRGEVFIHGADLDEINLQRIEREEEPFANPRNAAAGSLRLLNSELVAERPLRVFFYDAVEPYFDTHLELLEALESCGLPTHGLHGLCADVESVWQYIQDFDLRRRDLSYETDGVVVKVNSIALRQTLGQTARFPRWATAYKFAPEVSETIVTAIACDVGRTGALTPVAELKPVKLSGTTVSNASLHNMDYIAEKDVRVGDTVRVQKAGEIIPQVVDVVSSLRPELTSPWQAPELCPACGEKVVRKEEESALRCVNPRCPGRLRAALFHFTRRSALNIDHIGRVLIEQLVERELVRDLADVFSLHKRRAELLGLDRMADKSVNNVLQSIDSARVGRRFSHVLVGLGIPFVGAVAAKLIAERYESLSHLLAQDPDEVQEQLGLVHGIGPKIAESVGNYLRDSFSRDMLSRMLELGVVATEPKEEPSVDGPLRGLSFCVTGTLSKSRDLIHAEIRSAGGSVHTSVKKGTTYLLAGEKVGQKKIDAATKKGAQVIDEEELRRLAADP